MYRIRRGFGNTCVLQKWVEVSWDLFLDQPVMEWRDVPWDKAPRIDINKVVHV